MCYMRCKKHQRKTERKITHNKLSAKNNNFNSISSYCVMLLVYANGSTSRILMLWCYCIRIGIEIYTFIQRKSALQNVYSVCFCFCAFFSLCLHQYDLHTNYTHYPLGNSSHTYPYVNCEHVLKHILLKYTQSERSIWYGGSIMMPRACEAIVYGICSPIPTFYTINLMALTA